MTEPLWKPRPAKVHDLAGARLAAVAEFRAAHPEVPDSNLRVVYAGPWLGVYDGGPRPAAPAAKRSVRVEAEPEADPVASVPPPDVPATELPAGDPRIPRGVKTWLNLAKKHGWRARVTYAVGPRIGSRGEVLEHGCYTICVAMQNDRGWRLVVEYRWMAGQQKWVLEDVLDGVNAAVLSTAWAKERMAA
jgi:hypothetical protein